MDAFTAHSFLSAFFSALKLRDVNVVPGSDLYEHIGKYHKEFMGVFIDIDIRMSNGTIYSEDIEGALCMLQTIGIIGKANTRYEKIVLKMNKDSANKIWQDCEDGKRDAISRLADMYLDERK